MSAKKSIQNFDGKLKIEAVLKSVLCGVIAGGITGLIAAGVFWFLEINGVILSIAAFLAVAVISSVIFYLVRFRPTVKSNAKRLDSYGLDERIITMVELQGDDSFIAQRQRLDAEENLQKLDSSKIKFRFARPVIVLAIVFGFLFVGMSAVETLSEIDLIPSGKEVWQVIFPPAPPRQFSVVYTAGRGGYLVGEAEQSVVEGETSSRVLAVGDEGFMFYMWSDGETNPSRADENVIKDLNISAIFIAVDDLSDPGGDEDEPTDVPGDEGQGPGGGEDPSESAGGKYIQVNQIIDGKTYYRDVYEEYYNLAMTYLENGEAIPDELREIIKAYYTIIK